MKTPEEVAEKLADVFGGPMFAGITEAAAIIAADRKEAVAEFARECVRECKAQTYKYTSSRSQSACEEVERRIKRLAREKGIDL